jgi:hypothetical protein
MSKQDVCEWNKISGLEGLNPPTTPGAGMRNVEHVERLMPHGAGPKKPQFAVNLYGPERKRRQDGAVRV